MRALTNGRMRAVGRLLALASCGAVLVSLPGAAAAGASAPANTFKLSGSGKGTLSQGPAAICLAGKEAAGVIELDDLVGSISGYANVANWTLVVHENKNGTFKIKELGGKDPLVGLGLTLKDHNLEQGDKESLNGTSGTVTVHGLSGSVHATVRNLTPTGYGKTIELSGRWSCTANSG